MYTGYAAPICLAFIGVHLFSHHLRLLDVTPRSIWLSVSGGISVSYVFVHLLPEIASSEAAKMMHDTGIGSSIEKPFFLMALVGLVIFYGLERLAKVHARQNGDTRETLLPSKAFWLHVISFSLYNFLIGYVLLHREEQGLANLLLYGLAMALHFLVTDYGLRKQHKKQYISHARWWISGAVAAGYLTGIFIRVSELTTASLIALLGGGVILNIMKEELPEERESRFSAFAAGVALYSGLLLVTS